MHGRVCSALRARVASPRRSAVPAFEGDTACARAANAFRQVSRSPTMWSSTPARRTSAQHRAVRRREGPAPSAAAASTPRPSDGRAWVGGHSAARRAGRSRRRPPSRRVQGTDFYRPLRRLLRRPPTWSESRARRVCRHQLGINGDRRSSSVPNEMEPRPARRIPAAR